MCLGKGTLKGPALPSAYSPKCVEGLFCELPLYGVLGNPRHPAPCSNRKYASYEACLVRLRVVPLCPRASASAPLDKGKPAARRGRKAADLFAVDGHRERDSRATERRCVHDRSALHPAVRLSRRRAFLAFAWRLIGTQRPMATEEKGVRKSEGFYSTPIRQVPCWWCWWCCSPSWPRTPTFTSPTTCPGRPPSPPTPRN